MTKFHELDCLHDGRAAQPGGGRVVQNLHKLHFSTASVFCAATNVTVCMGQELSRCHTDKECHNEMLRE